MSIMLFSAFVHAQNDASQATTNSLKYALPDTPTLYLDVTLNGVRRGLFPFKQIDKGLWASISDYKKIGLTQALTEPLYDVYTIPRLKVVYDEAQQTLKLDIASSEVDLPVNKYSTLDETYYPSTGAPGLMLNYNVYSSYNAKEQVSAMSVFSDVRVFENNVLFSSTSITSAGTDQSQRTTRFDSVFQQSFQDEMLTVRLGDSVSIPPSWGRSVRFGGIQIARDLKLRPHMVTTPFPDFFGSVTSPSNIDLFINGIKQFNAKVSPGPFEISTLPLINGYGNAQMVITDAQGQTQTIEVPVFVSDALFKKGVYSWAIDAGKVRLDYGQQSFNYGDDWITNGSMRYGITDSMTLDGSVELTKDLTKLGIGLVTVPFPELGAFSTRYVESHYGGTRGSQWAAGYRWNNRLINFGGSYEKTQTSFMDIGRVYGAKIPRESYQVFTGVNLGKIGSLSSNFIAQSYDKDTSKILNLSWYKGVTKDSVLSLSYNQSFEPSSEWAAMLSYTLALDNKVSVSARMARRDNNNVFSFNASKPANTQGGIGWKVGSVYDAASSSLSGMQKQVEVEYLNRYGRATLGADSNSYYYAQLSGAMIMMNGGVFLTRDVPDAFAVVSTSGVPNVPVFLENRPMGTTDSDGLLFISPLFSYQKNKISIDSLHLPPGYSISYVDTVVVPSKKGGVIVPFPMEPASAALISFLNEDGTPLPLGTRLFFNNRTEPVLVGYEGQAYLEKLSQNEEIVAKFPDKLGRYLPENICYINLTFDVSKATQIQKLQNIICRKTK